MPRWGLSSLFWTCTCRRKALPFQLALCRLNDGCCSLPQIRSIDLYLYGLGNTPLLLSANCATTAWTTICCLTSCRPFLSAVLDLKKPWRASEERLQVDRVTPQTCQHCIDQTGTSLSHTIGVFFCCYVNGSNLVSRMLQLYKKSLI